MKKILLSAVVLVIAGVIYSGVRFTDNGNGTVSDAATGLVWTKCSLTSSGSIDTSANCAGAGTRTWEQALTDCEGLSYAGRTNWRLPNINELKSIIDYKKSNPSINVSYFPGTASAYYWSSSTYIINPADAWVVYFLYGTTGGGGALGGSVYVRCATGP